MAVARRCERCSGPIRAAAPKTQRWCGKKCSGAAHAEAARQRAVAEGRTRNCVRCTAVFVVSPKYRPNQRHCGQACFFADKKAAGYVTLECARCDKSFTIKRSTFTSTNQRYCSHPCALADLPKCGWCQVHLPVELRAMGFCSDSCSTNDELGRVFRSTGVRRGRCGQCGTVKPADEFHVERSNRSGLSNQCKACAQAYYLDNKDAYRRRNFLKRGGKAEHRIPFTAAEKEQRWAMWGGRCWVCGIADATQEDHVKPLHAGGWDCLSNLRPICGPCNTRKRGAWPLPEAYRFRGFIPRTPREGSDAGFKRVGRGIARCRGCGKEWETLAHRARAIKYCGAECKSTAASATMRARRFGDRTCEGCRSTFEAKTSKQRFCGADCRLRSQAERRQSQRRSRRVAPGQQELFP